VAESSRTATPAVDQKGLTAIMNFRNRDPYEHQKYDFKIEIAMSYKSQLVINRIQLRNRYCGGVRWPAPEKSPDLGNSSPALKALMYNRASYGHP
jgi:hypothetical protein